MDIDSPLSWTDGLGQHHTAPPHRQRLNDVLARVDLSHFSHKSWCGQEFIHAYRRNPESPSGVTLLDSFPDCDEIRSILAASCKRTQEAGQMGYAACAARMTGR